MPKARVRAWRTGHDGVLITNAREADAIQAELRKPPSRLGVWILRHLGYTGRISPQVLPPAHHLSHERSVRRPGR